MFGRHNEKQDRNDSCKQGNRTKALFILKRRHDYSTDLPNFTNYTVATGMYNSAKFVSDMLVENKIHSDIAVVIDNNCIDKEVHQHKATHVFIEGIWVIPEKFDILKKLHPNVDWIVRCHSELPFLAQEGMAIKWILECVKKGIKVACNSPRACKEIRELVVAKLSVKPSVAEGLIPLLMNYYPVTKHVPDNLHFPQTYVNISCFGAIRPLKNHLMQAVAAINFAEKRNLRLRFHINSGRIESNGNNALKNVKELFSHITKHRLVEHEWAEHDKFKQLVSSMDMCMQVSLSETFNIVTADAVSLGVPVVVSDEISWINPPYANPNSASSIVEVMEYVWKNKKKVVKVNHSSLKNYSTLSEQCWVSYINKYTPTSSNGLVYFLWSKIQHIFGVRL